MKEMMAEHYAGLDYLQGVVRVIAEKISEIKDSIIIALFSRFIILLISIISNPIPFGIPGAWELDLPIIGSFVKWDSWFYLQIAREGYSLQKLWAFRPLYPLILRLLGTLFTPFFQEQEAFIVAGMIWNLITFVFAVVFLYKLTILLIDQESAFYSVIFLCFFPSSVFFTALYTESTYIFLTVSAMYYLERNRVSLATMFAVLAGFTRPEGFLLFIPFIYRILILERKKKIYMILSSFVIFLTLPLFILYAYFQHGDPFIPFSIEQEWPKITLIKMFTSMSLKEIIIWFNEVHIISLIVIVIAILSFLTYFISIKLNKKAFIFKSKININDKKMPYYLWSVLVLGIILLEGGQASHARLVLTLFPIIWTNSYWVKKNRIIIYLLLPLYGSMMGVGALLFIKWYQFL